MAFLNCDIDQQISKIIAYKDSKLLQVHLGPFFCIIWNNWLSHCIFSSKVVDVTRILRYQLPVNITRAHIQILRQKFPAVYRELPTLVDVSDEKNMIAALNEWHEKIKSYKATKNDVKCVNQALKDAEQKILDMYKDYTMTPENLDYLVENLFLNDESSRAGKQKALLHVDEIKKNVELSVVDLNWEEHYNDLYKEVLKNKSEYSFRIEEGQDIFSLYNNKILTKSISGFVEGDERLKSIESAAYEAISNLDALVFEVFDKLIDIVLSEASLKTSHPLHLDIANSNKENVAKCMRHNWKTFDKSEILNKYLDQIFCGNHTKKDISIDFLIILIVNGASLLHYVRYDTRESRAIKEILKEFHGEHEALVNKSIFTIVKKAHDILFNFSFEKNNIDMFSLVTTIPNQDGYFGQDVANSMIVPFKSGDQGAEQFMNLIQSCLDKTDNLNAFDRFVMFFTSPPTVEDREIALRKLYECVNVGYLAVRSNCDKVIIDYITEIKDEAKQNKNFYLKKLYENFHDILQDTQVLPKRMWLVRCFRYIRRTLKWSPAWEKILNLKTVSNDVSEWSQDRFDIIVAMEKKMQSDEKERLEKERMAMEDSYAKELQEKQLAEKTLKMSLDLNQAITLKIRDIMRISIPLLDIVIDSQDQIVHTILKYAIQNDNQFPLKLLDGVIEKIKFNQRELIQLGSITGDLVREYLDEFAN